MNLYKYQSTRTWTILLLSLGGLFISAGLAKQGRLILGEEHLLEVIYGLPDSLRLIFLAITMFGSAWILAILLILMLLKERFDIAIRLLASSGVAYFAAGLAKQFVGRPRPGILANVQQRELLVFGYGFPSAHTALATTIGLVLAVYLPKNKRWIVPVWIILVAVSRLYLGVHAPLDIVGGFCIGVMAATTVLLILPPHKNIPKLRLAKQRSKA